MDSRQIDIEAGVEYKMREAQAKDCASCRKQMDEKLFNQTMEAKKSGWDDCVKFWRLSDYKKQIAQEIREKLETKPDCWDCKYFDSDECGISQHPIKTKDCLLWQAFWEEYK